MDKLKTILIAVLSNALSAVCLFLLMEMRSDLRDLVKDNATNKADISNLKEFYRAGKKVESTGFQKQYADKKNIYSIKGQE